MKTAGILEVTDRLYGSSQRVYLNTNWSRDSRDSHEEVDRQGGNYKLHSFEDFLSTI